MTVKQASLTAAAAVAAAATQRAARAVAALQMVEAVKHRPSMMVTIVVLFQLGVS
jgi:hypothetical protein